MELNIKVLGWLHIVLGILGLLVGAFVLFILLTVGVAVQEDQVLPIMLVVGLFVAGIMAVLSVPGVIVGIGLIQFRPWARVLALVLAALNLLNFPFGTILAIYTAISLLNPDSERLFAPRF